MNLDYNVRPRDARVPIGRPTGADAPGVRPKRPVQTSGVIRGSVASLTGNWCSACAWSIHASFSATEMSTVS